MPDIQKTVLLGLASNSLTGACFETLLSQRRHSRFAQHLSQTSLSSGKGWPGRVHHSLSSAGV